MSSHYPSTIPVVVIGVHRSAAVELTNVFAGTSYYLAAVLDLYESPKNYQYSAQNLGAVLHSIYPRPQILISGTAVERIVPEVRQVWQEYVNGILKTENREKQLSLFVPVSFNMVPTPFAQSAFAHVLCCLVDRFPLRGWATTAWDSRVCDGEARCRFQVSS
jgi:hypothetical protein